MMSVPFPIISSVVFGADTDTNWPICHLHMMLSMGGKTAMRPATSFEAENLGRVDS